MGGELGWVFTDEVEEERPGVGFSFITIDDS